MPKIRKRKKEDKKKGKSKQSKDQQKSPIDVLSGLHPSVQAMYRPGGRPEPEGEKENGVQPVPMYEPPGLKFDGEQGEKKEEGDATAGMGEGQIDERKPITRHTIESRPRLAAMNKRTSMKEIFEKVGSYEAVLVKPVPDANEEFVKNLGAVNRDVMTAHQELQDAFVTASERYNRKSQARLIRSKTRSKLRGAADDCARIANIMQSQYLALNKIYDDLMTAYRSNPLSVQELGGKPYGTMMEEQEVYKLDTSRAKVLGSGAINTVYSDTFQGKKKVFKEGSTHVKKKGKSATELTTYQFRLLPEAQQRNRPDVVKFANTAQRDVAVSRVNKLLNFDVIADTQLAKSDTGQISSLMDFVEGSQAGSVNFWSQKEGEDRKTAARRGKKEAREYYHTREMGPEYQVEGILYRLGRKDNDMTPKEAQHQIKNALSTLPSKGREVYELSDPRMSSQLLKLQVVDWIVGHVDRHLGNIMVGKDGKMTGIDNDTSFSQRTGDSLGNTEGIHVDLQKSFKAAPKELREAVNKVSEEDVANALTGLLPPDLIQAACTRLRELKKHFETIPETEITRENYNDFKDENCDRNYLSSIEKNMGKEFVERAYFQEGDAMLYNEDLAQRDIRNRKGMRAHEFHNLGQEGVNEKAKPRRPVEIPMESRTTREEGDTPYDKRWIKPLPNPPGQQKKTPAEI